MKRILIMALLGASFGVMAESFDVSTVAGNMYVAYYNGGATAMMNQETSCWRKMPARNVTEAEKCLVTWVAGVVVEGAVATREGRQPIPFYNMDAMAPKRKAAEFERAGLTPAEIQQTRDFMGEHTDEIMYGLMNAGFSQD